MAASIVAILLIASVVVNIAEGTSTTRTLKKEKQSLLVVFNSKASLENQQELIRATGGIIRKDFRPIVNAVSIEVDKPNLPLIRDAIDKTFKDSVKYVEEDQQVQLLHHLDIANTSPPPSKEYQNFGSWSIAHIGSYIAYQKGVKGDGVKVAVLDSGIDYNHPDLAANYAGGYNFVTSNSDPFDDSGHGTFVAGIIAAKDDGNGIIGVAPHSRLYAVKVLDNNGIGSIINIIAGLQWCINNNIDIVSMSFGLQSDSPALHDAIANAYSHGIVLVAAAGNTPGIIDYPAAYSEVIAVGATDQNDVRASFSATGPKLELVAPGVQVVSTYPLGLGGPYHTDDGTSEAAPHVAGVAALIKSTDERSWYPAITNGDGKWTNDEIRKVLDSSAIDLGASGRDSEYGYGRVDAFNAIKLSSSSTLLVSTKDGNGNPIYGYYTILSQNGGIITTGFTPATFSLNNNQQYLIETEDYGQYVFDHWEDTGSTARERSISISADSQITAVYRNASNNNSDSSNQQQQQSPSSSSSSSSSSHSGNVIVKSVNSDNNAINGYYVTLSQNGAVISTGFTPATFTLIAGQNYQVAVQDYGQYFFNKWLGDGSVDREKTVTLSTNSSSIVITAVYANINESPSSPPSQNQSIISIITKDSMGNLIPGYYTTLWQKGSLIKWSYSPTRFSINNGQEYQLVVADYGSFAFDHWEARYNNNSGDSTIDYNRFHTIISDNSTSIDLVAVYRRSS